MTGEELSAQITKVITAGVPEGELLHRVLLMFPNLTMAELSVALQVAQATAERKAMRPQ